jgi:hypothetical protein
MNAVWSVSRLSPAHIFSPFSPAFAYLLENTFNKEYNFSGALLSKSKTAALWLRFQAEKNARFIIRSSGRRTGSRGMDRQEPLAPGFWQATDEGQDFSIDRSAAESSQSPADATGSSRSGAKAPALAGSKSARFAEFLIQFLFLISMLFLIHFNNKTSRKHSYCIFILYTI